MTPARPDNSPAASFALPRNIAGFLRCLALASVFFSACPRPVCAAPISAGVEINNEPISFLAPDGRPTGFAVDLITAIGSEMNVEISTVSGPWTEIFERFKSGEIDVLVSLAYTKERDQFIDFSVNHLSIDGSIFVLKSGRAPKKIEDLANLRIAMPPGGFTHQFLSSRGLVGRPVFVPSLAASIDALENGECDAIAATDVIVKHFIRKQKIGNVQQSSLVIPGFSYRYHLGVRAGDSDRLAMLNEGLARIRANGTYDRIYQKWIGPLEPRHFSATDLAPYLVPAILLLLLTLTAILWQRRMLARVGAQSEALRQSEERLTRILEAGEDGFWDWDLQTGHIEYSNRCASMLGYSPAELAPLSPHGPGHIHPDDQPRYDAYRHRLITAGDNRHDIEYRAKTKSGGWLWILDRGKIASRSPDDRPVRVAGTRTDITRLKQAQQELERQEALFRFIYEHAPVGLSWLGRQQAETRIVNPAHQRITGVPVSKSRDSASYVEATHPGDRERQRILQDKLDRGEIEHFSMEKRYVHPDGSIVWALIAQLRYVDPVTRAAQTVTTLVDISSLKRAEEEREQLHLKILDTQKLESLGVLAGGIAHDFNNLLTVVLANANFIRVDSPPDFAHSEHLEHIEVAARRAADLCRQMLAYAGKGSFIVEHLDLDRLVQDTAQLLQISISKKARLILQLAGRLPPIEADPSQLQQVVMNLVINASDALGENAGEIRLRTWRGRLAPSPASIVHSFDLPDTDCACLEIADTGSGMAPATLARIFDPFFTTKFAGRGLGLAAVLGIVRACHGALTVESTPGHGTRFRLYLPAASTPSAPPIPVPSLAPPTASSSDRGLILIADDETSVLKTFDLQLRRHGFKTILATDGHEAVRLFTANPHGFSALLLDLTMPGLNGAQVLREVRALNPVVRAVVMSGFSEKDVLDRLSGLGPVAILQKPFTIDVLLARLTAS